MHQRNPLEFGKCDDKPCFESLLDPVCSGILGAGEPPRSLNLLPGPSMIQLLAHEITV